MESGCRIPQQGFELLLNMAQSEIPSWKHERLVGCTGNSVVQVARGPNGPETVGRDRRLGPDDSCVKPIRNLAGSGGVTSWTSRYERPCRCATRQSELAGRGRPQTAAAGLWIVSRGKTCTRSAQRRIVTQDCSSCVKTGSSNLYSCPSIACKRENDK